MGRAGRAGFWAWIAVFVLLATGCGSPVVGALNRASGPPSAVEPPEGTFDCQQPGSDGSFSRVDPSKVDMQADAVAKAIAYASDRGAQSVRVYRHDCLVGTSWLDDTNSWSPMDAWSMTKGVVSIIAGRAYTQGKLDLDATIGTYLQGLDVPHAALTVRQFLTQTTGLRFAWANDLNDAANFDSAALVLKRPFEADPGSTFIYAQTTVTALVSVIEAAVGEDLQAYAEREVFEPIGIRHNSWHWDRDGSGRTQGFAFLEMSPDSFARLGSLLLNDGVWNGRQIISTDYIRQGSMGTGANTGYGFLWRTNFGPPGVEPSADAIREGVPAATARTYWLSGMFNQNVFVLPELDMVVVRMGLPADVFGDPYGESVGARPDWDHRFFQFLLGGVTDVDVPDPGPWQPGPEGLPNGIDADHLIALDLLFGQPG
ncbi:MAG: serine hydrolase [Microthrixaceae bacterium]